MNMERQRDFSDLRQAAEEDPAATGLDLVERTAELIRATEEHAAEMVARAEAAAAHLQEEMRLAELRHRLLHDLAAAPHRAYQTPVAVRLAVLANRRVS